MLQDPITTAAAPTSSWIDLIERLGVSVFLVLFICLVAWKLLPHVVEWFKTSSDQAKTISEAIPDMRSSLQKIAHEGQAKLDTIDRQTAGLDEKADRILSRLDGRAER